MPITAIHPGEHLAEELEALGMSAAELARQLKVPTNRITAIINGQRAITGFLRYQSGVLAESAKPVRTASCRTESGKVNQDTSNVEEGCASSPVIVYPRRTGPQQTTQHLAS